MKKLLQTSDEYYNRKQIVDFMEEDIQSMIGCRRLAATMLVLLALAIIAFIFLR